MSVLCFKDVPPREVLTRCVEVYASAFGQAPYFEPADQAEGLRDRILQYRMRDGLLIPVVQDAGGQIRGFALAVTAHPGDWWRDQAAANLDRELAGRWLGDACLEVVHVAVDAEAQHRGYGRALMAALEAGTEATTGVLSCHPEAEGAQRLYLGDGWQTLSAEFRTQPAQLGYWLMAKDFARNC